MDNNGGHDGLFDKRPGEVLRAATRRDIPAMRAVLAEAFHQDPVFVWLQPDEVARPRMLNPMFDALLRQFHPVQQGSGVVERDGVVVSASNWAAPGRWRTTRLQSLRATPRLLGMGRDNLKVFGDRGPRIDKAMVAKHPTEPHWYLSTLGSDPDTRGTGAGSRLIRAGLQRAGAQGLPAYLECIPLRIALYERHGFSICHDLDVPEGAPEMVGMMWRP